MSILAKMVRGLDDKTLMRVVQAATPADVCRAIRAANDDALRPLFLAASHVPADEPAPTVEERTHAAIVAAATEGGVAAPVVDETPVEEGRGPRPTDREALLETVHAWLVANGSASNRTIASALSLPESTLTGLLTRLEDAGRIRRIRDGRSMVNEAL